MTRCITRKKQIRPLQLMRLPLPPHRDLIPPDILRLLGHEIRDLGGHVPGGHGVRAGELDPFDC